MCDREYYPEKNVGGFFSNRKMCNAVSVTVWRERGGGHILRISNTMSVTVYDEQEAGGGRRVVGANFHPVPFNTPFGSCFTKY